MKPIQPHETAIVGSWIFQDNRMFGDDACLRIDWLMANVLKEIAHAAGGWETLFVDPNDGRHWIRTYPQSHLHGGGPPSLRYIRDQEARAQFDLDKLP